MRRTPRTQVWPGLIAALVTLPLLWPLLAGETLFLRDIGTTHRPAWATFSEIGFAKINPAASFGQHYRGNPNLLIFYPFPKSARAVEVHVAFHFVFLAVGFACWLSRELRPLPAVVGAVTFCLSGYVVSAATSINALTTISWLPWLFLATSSTRRGPWAFCMQTLVIAVFSVSGEPVLIAAGLLLATLLSWRGKTTFRFALTAATALLITFALHRETLLLARESSRVVRGFGFDQAMVYSLHPGRLLETLLPGLFGSPSRITAGAWWGYEVSRDSLPYVFSTTLGVIPVALVITLAFLDRLRSHRGWWIVLFSTLLVSMGGYLPGARAMWEALPLLHAIRFPIKAFLFTTLAVAVLAAHAVEHVSNVERGRAQSAAALIALLGLLAFGAGLQHQRIIEALVQTWWNPAWQAQPSIVLEPIARMIAPRLLGAALMLVLLLVWISRPRQVGAQVLMIAAVVVDLTLAARNMLPTTRIHPRDSPIIQKALEIPGRLFERAAKDLDTVRNGTFGRYPADDAAYLAVAQERQAWSLYGSMRGLRYAYDRSPDGSYTWRNQVVQEYLERATWQQRVKWLRGAGVGSVLASDLTTVIPGLRPVLRDDTVGIPVTLYAIEPRLPELRAPTNVRWVRTPDEAIAEFRRPAFDERSDVTMEGAPRETGTQSTISIRALLNEPDRIVFRSNASHQGFVFLARSYTRRVQAAAGATSLRVVPANVHLCGIEVPAGEHVIAVTF